jgi:hypothetical protein
LGIGLVFLALRRKVKIVGAKARFLRLIELEAKEFECQSDE